MVKKANTSAAALDAQSFFGVVENSVASFTDAAAESKATFEAFTTSMKAAVAGAETIRADLLAYSQTSLERAVAQAQALATAKTPQEVIALQTGFAKTAFDAYVAQLSSGLATANAVAKDAMAPITDRATALQSRFKFPVQ